MTSLGVISAVPHLLTDGFFFVAQQPKSALGCLIVVSRSHIDTHTHTRQDSSERVMASTFTTHNEHKRRAPMPSARFEPAIE
jgi:hypothetical protein